MKRIFTFIVSLLSTASLFAQSAEDGLLFSQEEYEGTARTVAMGGAFTALGGDLGAVSFNPASSGVFRYSQFTFTPSTTKSRAISTYLGQDSKDKNRRLGVSNLGYVSSFDTGNYSGLLNFNFGIVYNRKNNLNSIMSAVGSTDASSYLGSLAGGLEGTDFSMLDYSDGFNPYYDGYAPWAGIAAYNAYLVDLDGEWDDAYIGATENKDGNEIFTGGMIDQTYNRKTTGSVQEYALNFGANFNDNLYLGANLNLLSVEYDDEQKYSEFARHSSDFQSGWAGMSQTYKRTTTGSGINLKIGAIYTPLPGLRIGATLTTATLYNLTDKWHYTMRAFYDSSPLENHVSNTVQTPEGYFDYQVKAPMRWSVGAAYTFDDNGLISIDYEGVDYSSISMKDYLGNPNEFSYENSYIYQNFKASHVLRIGGEYWIASNFALRGGYTSYSAAADYLNSRQYLSFGLGWKIDRSTTLDLAWQKRLEENEDFTLYDDYAGIAAPVGQLRNLQKKFLITLGFKF